MLMSNAWAAGTAPDCSAVKAAECALKVKDPAGTGGGFGTEPVITAAENDLLWAEGLIRSGGNLLTASNLINNTRVTRGGLAPATPADLETFDPPHCT